MKDHSGGEHKSLEKEKYMTTKIRTQHLAQEKRSNVIMQRVGCISLALCKVKFFFIPI